MLMSIGRTGLPSKILENYWFSTATYTTELYYTTVTIFCGYISMFEIFADWHKKRKILYAQANDCSLLNITIFLLTCQLIGEISLTYKNSKI